MGTEPSIDSPVKPAPGPDNASEHTWRIAPGERGVVAVSLATVVVLGAGQGGIGYAGQEISWKVGLNAARPEGLVFGRDIVYTYGPWGFLDHPITLSYPQYVVGVLFGIVAMIALWTPLHMALRRAYSPGIAAAIATVVAVSCAAACEKSSMVVSGLAAFAILHLAARRPSDARIAVSAFAVAAGLVAGLVLQIKLSAGFGAVVVALIVACATSNWVSAILNVGATSTGMVGSFLCCWSIAGQPFGVIPDWLRASMQIVTGYSEAMGIEAGDALLGYLVAFVLAGVLAWWAVYGLRHIPVTNRVAIVVLTLGMLDMAFKAGFIRHDEVHEFGFFATTSVLVIAVGVVGGRRRTMVVALVASLFMTTQGLALLDVNGLRNEWRLTLQNTVFPWSAASTTTEARAIGAGTYQLPQDFVDRIGRHPMSIDPSEAALAVAYQMNWHPVPVFQTHVAYTSYLDDLNAEAARNAPPDQVILRLPVQTIDGRNVRWETPEYLLTLACDYTQDLTDGTWSLMRHDTPRCAAEVGLDPREVAAGETVAVPKGGSGQIVVAHFVPDTEGIVTRVLHTLFKDPTAFVVTADGLPYRVPQQLASGPLMMVYPGRGDQGLFPEFRYGQVSFSMPGTLTFGTVPLDR